MRQKIYQWFFSEFYSTLQLWLLSKIRERLSFSFGIHFTPGVLRSQNLLDSNLDYSVTSDGAPEIEVSFFNISRVILAVWALARSCTNNYSLCFTSLFISEIIFSISILQWCFAFTFVFGSTIQKFYKLPISPQKPLLALEKL